ncbi:unnamed protein product [Owenia fusiformis]|uniref:Uncharacterized protein n=1 Tax=Owenia fusiformis TaxID=6347 RepID=A0A8J1UI79_OWEFU|nr:unnamed protein product [Owenia fusiformis]
MKYTLKPLILGAEVEGIKLSETIPHSTVESLKEDVTKHKLLVFRDQGKLTAERQVEITEWFGELETVGFECHPKCSHPKVLRLSNDATEGYKGFGNKGFHIDGSFLEKPNSYSIYHIITPNRGKTIFVSLNAVWKGLSKQQKQKWKELYVVKKWGRDKQGNRMPPGSIVHPLVYRHPLTHEKTLCVHLGKTAYFNYRYKQPDERLLNEEESAEIIREIKKQFDRNNKELQYGHEWQPGDFIITDNLALGHVADEATQQDPSVVGLRILHRTVTKGTHRPVSCASSTTKCKLL